VAGDHGRVITAALFDFGGVILSSPFEAFAAYERTHGLPEGFIRLVNSTDPDTNAWARLERSQVGLEEFCALFESEARALGQEVDGAGVLGCLHGEVRPTMVEAVRRCAAHLKTGLLTNNFVLRPAEEDVAVVHDDRAVETGAIIGLFDVVVESSVVGVRKPDPRFYEVACERLAIRPEEAVFLDDLGVNLKPARAMGMTTIKVVDPDEAIAELEAVVGFPLT
jgi:putative hydrolase of the HAD superfamily